MISKKYIIFVISFIGIVINQPTEVPILTPTEAPSKVPPAAPTLISPLFSGNGTITKNSLVVGSVVGGIIGFILLILLFICCCCCGKKGRGTGGRCKRGRCSCEERSRLKIKDGKIQTLDMDMMSD